MVTQTEAWAAWFLESVAMHRPSWKSDEQTDAQRGLTLTRYNNTALAGPGLSRSVVTSLEEIASCEASASEVVS